MTWSGRKTDGGDERAVEPSVASELAEFLVQATEENALRQAIDEGVRDLEQADARSTDIVRSTDRDATQ